MTPTTKYAKNGDVHIAYQVVGEGDRDVLFVPGWVSHLEYAWEVPSYAHFLKRLASFSRLILLDRRGMGLSDRAHDLPTLEQRMDDVRAVMDAAGSKRAALVGLSEGGPMCMMFAATYPERTAALVLYGTFARMVRTNDYPIGLPSELLETLLDQIEQNWGNGSISADHFGPGLAHDDAFRQAWARFERLAVSPGGMKTLIRMVYDTDARHTLPVIRVPTLVLHRKDDRVTRVAGARYIAERIQGVKYVELDGADHFPWVGDTETILEEIQEFVTGSRRGPEPDRVLATVMFTDIVGATERAVELGDRRWRELIDRHHAEIRAELAHFRGREIDTAGDGFFAVFDGPARAVRCAQAIVRELRRLGLDVRVGLHTGECEIHGEKLSGIAVHTGARIAAVAGAGQVLVSSTVKDLVAGSGIRFEDERVRHLKGIPGEWRLYTVTP